MHPRLDGMSLFPFPKTEPSMDFSRRRGPPAPLQLGAAYQAKVLRGYNKFASPQPLENCLLVDSACDQVIRQSSNVEMQRRRDSAESRRRSQSSTAKTLYSLDETQIDSTDDGSDHTIWSYDDTLCDRSDSRSSCTFSNDSHGSIEDEKKASSGGRFAQAWSTHGHSTDTETSHIKLPAMCRIEQAGVHQWTDGKVQSHHRSKSV